MCGSVTVQIQFVNRFLQRGNINTKILTKLQKFGYFRSERDTNLSKH